MGTLAEKTVVAKTLRQTGECEELNVLRADKAHETRCGEAQDEATEVSGHIKDFDL